MKLYQVVSILVLAVMALSMQLTTSCNATLSTAYDIEFDVPDGAAPTFGSPEVVQTANHYTASSPELNVLTYNVFLRPGPVGWGDAIECRGKEIGRELAKRAANLDIVLLNESFAKPAIERLVSQLGNRFPYRVLRQPKAQMMRTNGGLSLLSRYPIRKVFAKSFDKCSMTDCFATKGFIHAIVEVTSNFRVNVIGTHLDAGSTGLDRNSRKRQISMIRNYMDHKNVGKTWPTILMGDLNVDGLRGPLVQLEDPKSEPSEYQSLLGALSDICSECSGASVFGGGEPKDVITARNGPWSYKQSNTLPFNTMNCTSQSLSPCDSPNEADNWEERERLDYIFLFDEMPSSQYAFRVQSAEHLDFKDDSCGTEYLSDHQAVRATLGIRRPTVASKP